MSSVKGGKTNERSWKSSGREYSTEQSRPMNTTIQKESCQKLRV